MPTAKVYEKNGSERGTVELSDELFGCEINEPVMHQAVVGYLANQRQGTASTKPRGEVKGGGKKPYRQKGTGRARTGTIRSPLWRGGGVVFGPQPRSYRKDLPKKVRRLALRSALSSRAKENDVVVVDALNYSEPKTKRFVELLSGIGIEGLKILFVMDKPVPEVVKSARNIPDVRLTLGNMVTIVISEPALTMMEEVFK
jgi:large subunit ribosomal protein L4